MSIDNIKVGKCYFLRNYGETTSFNVLEALENDFRIKDLLTLELYNFNELIKYGKGPDFDLFELAC